MVKNKKGLNLRFGLRPPKSLVWAARVCNKKKV